MHRTTSLINLIIYTCAFLLWQVKMSLVWIQQSVHFLIQWLKIDFFFFLRVGLTKIEWQLINNCEFVLSHILILNAKHGNSARADRVAPAGNQQLICLRSLLINMDNFDPQYGWGFLSNWITVSLLASKYCLELIPLSVARKYLHYICWRVCFFPFRHS